MAVSTEFQNFVLEQLAGVSAIMPQKMFGGVGLYCRKIFFGILFNNNLYLKVDDSNRQDYEKDWRTKDNSKFGRRKLSPWRR